jgi:hypothetical protein
MQYAPRWLLKLRSFYRRDGYGEGRCSRYHLLEEQTRAHHSNIPRMAYIGLLFNGLAGVQRAVKHFLAGLIHPIEFN